MIPVYKNKIKNLSNQLSNFIIIIIMPKTIQGRQGVLHRQKTKTSKRKDNKINNHKFLQPTLITKWGTPTKALESEAQKEAKTCTHSH